VVVSVALLCVGYLAISALGDSRGTLGTDTGGKLATLGEMDRNGSWTPDVGYWAADVDPDGVAHPLYYTVRFDDAYVNVTTLPMLFVAKPLYDIGGTRLALLLPMLGGVLSALAARALAARLGSTRPNVAFWVVGAASPVAVYALDLWEHTLGLACMAWAVVWLVDLVESRRPVGLAGLSAGALVGVGATMRTESLLYGAVFITVALLIVARRSAFDATRAASMAVVGVLVVLGAGEMLERAVLGEPLRSTRATGTATNAGGHFGTRLREGLRTSVGLNYADFAVDMLVGVLIVAGLVAIAVFGLRGTRHRRHAVEAVVAVAVLYAVRLRTGLSFVSGMFAATPIAILGMMRHLTGHAQSDDACGVEGTRGRWLVLTALGCLPAVWAVQYIGGAAPQWGGRYVLLSGFVLGVLGAVALEDVPTSTRRVFGVLAVAVTAYGMLLVVDRTNDSARIADTLLARDEQVVVARFGHVFREIGSDYRRDRQWLTAVDQRAIDVTRSVIADRAPETIAVITYPVDPDIDLDGYEVTTRVRLQFFSEGLEIRRYERVDQ
jgi:hypothetical protein